MTACVQSIITCVALSCRQILFFFFFLMIRPPPSSTLFPYTTLSRSQVALAPLSGAARVIDTPDSVRAIDAAELNRHDWKGAKRVLFRTRSTLRGWMDSAFHRD